MNEKIKQKESGYIEFYEQKLKQKINFLSKLKIKNTLSSEELSFNNNEEYLIRNDYLYLVYNSIALQKRFENSSDYIAIFITNTLASKFHEYKQLKSGKFVRNTKFEQGNTINLGYKILITFFKKLYKDFKVNNEYKKIEFVKVIEPHKDFTPHLHAILYLKKEYLGLFKKHFYKKVKGNNNLGRSDFEIIDNCSRSASYILKYVQKDFSSDNDRYKVYYGWKLQNKIRAYTFTRQFIPREVFNRLSFYLSKDFVYDMDSLDTFAIDNYYELVHKFTTLHQEIVCTQTGEIKTKQKNYDEDDMFMVKINKDRIKIEDCHDHKILEIEKALLISSIKSIQSNLKKYKLYDLFNYYVKKSTSLNCLQLESIVYIFYLDMFLQSLKNQSRYQYKTRNYQIYKKHPIYARYDLMYDKKEWSLLK